MTPWKGEASPRAGIIFVCMGILLISQAAKTFNFLGFLLPHYYSSVQRNQHEILVPLEVFIPLAIVPYIIFRIVRYISLELYLRN